MRAFLILSLLVFLCPAGAMAQGAPRPAGSAPGAGASPSAAPAVTPPAGPGERGGRDFTRDEFVERAKRQAEKRFNKMDANHDGILTADERRAFRAKGKQQPDRE
jgi:hypothetical protein